MEFVGTFQRAFWEFQRIWHLPRKGTSKTKVPSHAWQLFEQNKIILFAPFTTQSLKNKYQFNSKSLNIEECAFNC